MKVLFLCWSYPSKANSAIGSFFRTHVEAMRDAGCEMEVVAPVPWVPRRAGRWKESWRTYVRLPRFEEVNGIPVHRPRYWNQPRSVDYGLFPFLVEKAVCKAVGSGFNYVHSNGAYPWGEAGLRLARRFRVGSVLTLHGGDVNNYPYRGPKERRRFKSVIKSTDVVIAVSGKLAEATESLTGVRPYHIPIGIDLDRFDSRKERETARKELGLELNQNLVLYVGNLIEAKGVALLAEAIGRLEQRDVTAVFVGSGPMKAELTSRERCLVTGPVANDAIRTWMSACDVLALPSFSEGLPTVLVEAGAVGIPVIASQVGGIPELLGDGGGRLISSGSVDELVLALEEYFEDGTLFRRGVETLHQRVVADYDSKTNARRLKQLLAE